MLGAPSRDRRGTVRVVSVDGVAVHTVEWEPPAPTERRVLLLHGLGAHTLSWEPFAGPLADRLGARVTAVDLLGFGRTRAVGRATTMAAQRRLVVALLEQLGTQLVVGNSMGASIGIGVTASRPDLVTGLVLLNPAVPHPRPGFGDWLRFAWMAPIAVPALGAGIVALRARALGPARLVDTSLAASLTRMDRLDPSLRDRMVALTAERLRWPDTAPAYADAARSLIAYLARGLHHDLAAAAAQRPVLLVHGTEDRLVPLEAAQHAVRLHALTFQTLDGMGHAPQLEDPTRVVDAVARWIAETSLPGWQASGSHPAQT